MSNAPDIERMFAYIGIKDGRYREFASGDNPEDALSTWALVGSTEADATGRPRAEPAAAPPVQRPDAFEQRMAARRPPPEVPPARPTAPPAMTVPPVTVRPGPMPRLPAGRPPSLAQRPPMARPPSLPPSLPPQAPPAARPSMPPHPAAAPSPMPVARPPSLPPQPRPPSLPPRPAVAPAAVSREQDRTAFMAPQATMRPGDVARSQPAPFMASRPADPAAATMMAAPPASVPGRSIAGPSAPSPSGPEKTLLARPAAPPPQPELPPAEGGLNRVFARLGGATPPPEDQPPPSGTPLSRIFRRLS